ncbi:MAG: o-succinylbenzoate--CoA ligase [Alphaproteobacteria bacterium]|nr:o-succinylbenzoate--CoA ligase [Alphaproteobacteria bacterium]
MRVIDFFDRGALLQPDRAFMIAEDGAVTTYRDAFELSHSTALAMIAAGFGYRKHAAIYSPNAPGAFDALLGIYRTGGAWVPINARNAVAENAYILNNNDTEFLFYHSEFEDSIKVIQEECPGIRNYVCLDRTGSDAPSFAAFVANQSGRAPDFPDAPEDICGIFPSGGTTGRPKGIVWTNQLFETMVAAMGAHMPPKKRPVHLCAAPMTHAAGVVALSLMAHGATNIIMNGVQLPQVMESIEKHGVTNLFLPPTAIYVMLAHPDVRKYDYSSLEYFVYAAAPMSVEKLKEAIDVFGPIMAQCYGQAEAPMICTYLTPEQHTEAIATNKVHRLASCGQPCLLTPVEIMDDDENILGPGERGEIVVRGSLVMAGYYKNKDATDEVSTSKGWHRTGDIGLKDEDGFIYIVDRKKDMIISGGFNVYPSEIEQVVWGHKAVQDCAVIGVPDEKWGEAVKAIVELKPGQSVTEDEIIALCKEVVGSVKAPKTVEFWNELPRSPVGKVRKKDMREKFWEGQDRAV